MPAEENPPQPPLDVNLDLIGLDGSATVGEDRKSKKEQNLVFGEPKRREQFSQAVHYARVATLCVAVIGGLTVFVIRLLHFVLPENIAANAGIWHCWLTPGQLGSIDTFVFGALATFVAQNVKRALVTERPRNED